VLWGVHLLHSLDRLRTQPRVPPWWVVGGVGDGWVEYGQTGIIVCACGLLACGCVWW